MPNQQQMTLSLGGAQRTDELPIVMGQSVVSAVNRLSSCVRSTTVINADDSVSMLTAAASVAGLVNSRQDQRATADAMQADRGYDDVNPSQRPSPYA